MWLWIVSSRAGQYSSLRPLREAKGRSQQDPAVTLPRDSQLQERLLQLQQKQEQLEQLSTELLEQQEKASSSAADGASLQATHSYESEDARGSQTGTFTQETATDTAAQSTTDALSLSSSTQLATDESHESAFHQQEETTSSYTIQSHVQTAASNGTTDSSSTSIAEESGFSASRIQVVVTTYRREELFNWASASRYIQLTKEGCKDATFCKQAWVNDPRLANIPTVIYW